MFHVRSECIKGGYSNVTMSDSNTITVKLLDELNNSNECELIISSEKTSQNTTFGMLIFKNLLWACRITIICGWSFSR